jgi:hypothetical protein
MFSRLLPTNGFSAAAIAKRCIKKRVPAVVGVVVCTGVSFSPFREPMSGTFHRHLMAVLGYGLEATLEVAGGFVRQVCDVKLPSRC